MKNKRKAKVARRKRSSNAVTGGPNTCRVTETYDLGNVLVNQSEEYNIPGIPAGSRAGNVAPNFGLYRIARVTFQIKPYYDTYIPNNGGPTPAGNFITTVPRLYWKMNRYGDAPNAFGVPFLQEQGSKPIRLDDKTVTISYKPNVLLADAGAVAAGLNGGSGQVKMTPWLSTDKEVQDGAFALSETLHYGHLMYIEADTVNNTTQPGVATVTAKVIWEFKNPRGLTASGIQKVVKQPGRTM